MMVLETSNSRLASILGEIDLSWSSKSKCEAVNAEVRRL